MKNELLSITKQYFDSVKGDFFEIEKNRRKYLKLTRIPSIIIGVIFLMSITPILGGILKAEIPKLLGPSIDILGITIQLNSIGLWWGISFILAILLLVFDFKYAQFVRNKTIGRNDAINNIPLCYLYNTVEEIKTFIVNERTVHIETAHKSIIEYFKEGEFIISYDPTKKKGLLISKRIENLMKNYTWFEINNSTSIVVKAISNFKEKIINRIEQKKDLEKIIPFLEDLLIYELLKTKSRLVNNKIENEESRNELMKTYILSFSKSINQLDKIELVPELKKKRWSNKIIYSLRKAIDLFSSGNILVLFISWYLLFFLIFSFSLLIGIYTLNIELDSKILIGAFTAPFLGAITITATIFKSKK